MSEDIRDKPYITHDDVMRLNFINKHVPYIFRRHYRQGLRSHVMEILHPSDLSVESSGIVVNGRRWFPKAKPFKIFRLFRTRLKVLQKALKEIACVKIVEKFLAPDYLARSNEFIVDYQAPTGKDLMLCGLQEYVAGPIIDPWSMLDSENLLSDLYTGLCRATGPSTPHKSQWIRHAQHHASIFVNKIKQMIMKTDHIPDLAGLGNMIMVHTGEIKLVDINNISTVFFDATIRLDDRGYPVCDKSIEALAMLERKILGQSIDKNERIYHTFLAPSRMEEVTAQEQIFNSARKAESST